MGNLVDTFIITPKKQWSQLLYVRENNDVIVPSVPLPFRPMLKTLLDTFGYMNRVMDNRDYETAHAVWETARPFEKKGVVFRRRYREECLQQVLRTIFYDTLLIIENDFNPEKYNYFIVVHSRDIISEKEWQSRMPEDQSFLNKTMESLVANGGPRGTPFGFSHSPVSRFPCRPSRETVSSFLNQFPASFYSHAHRGGGETEMA